MKTKQTRHAISKDFWVVSILIVVSFGIYANSLQNDFVWDDKTLFVDNYHRWQWKNFNDLLTRPDNLFGSNDNRFYRPLPNVTYLIDRYLWRREAPGYHLFNIFFHVLSTIAVYAVARSLIEHPYAGIITALLFAVHPVHTEVVAWVNGRNNAMAGAGYLLSFYYYIRYRNQNKKTALCFSLAAFAGSLFSKEYAVTFPVILLLYELAYRNDHRSAGSFVSQMIVRCLPYISIMAVYLIIRAGVLPTLGSVPFHLEMLDDRLLTLPKTVWLYLRLLVLPMDLNAFYNVSFVKSPWTAQFILPSVALLLLLAGWKFCYTRQPHLFFGLGWIFVTLLPVLNVIPLSNTTTFFSERYLYIPCFGFCLAIGCLFKGLLELKGRPTRKRLFMTALCLLVVFEVYGFETVKRNLVWRNELTLWLDTARKSPDSFMVRTNLSLALYDRGRLNEAHREIREAIRLYPQHDTPYYILGVILYQKAEFHDSITALKEALRINPHQKDALNLMASIKKMLSDG